MTPWELAKTSEHSHQRAIFAWCAMAANYGYAFAENELAYDYRTRPSIAAPMVPIPPLRLLFAIHNQGHGDKIRGAQAKAEGVKAGVPDIMLPVPHGGYCGLFIELKLPRTGKRLVKITGTSEKQNEWHALLTEQGYRVIVAYGWLEAVAALRTYLNDWK